MDSEIQSKLETAYSVALFCLMRRKL